MVGSESTILVVLRGNSASGKSTVVDQVRRRCGGRIAIVGQDVLRRGVLKERDVAGGLNIELIDITARFALDHGYHVLIEGILYAAHYGEMLHRLHDDHRGTTHFFYWDVSFEETLRRHASKPQAAEYGAAEMREWYRPLDLLPFVAEQIIPESTTLEGAVENIATTARLAATGQERHP